MGSQLKTATELYTLAREDAGRDSKRKAAATDAYKRAIEADFTGAADKQALSELITLATRPPKRNFFQRLMLL